MTRLEVIAAKIRATGYPLSSCLSQPFADGTTHTVWFDRLTPEEVASLRRMFGDGAAPMSPGMHRQFQRPKQGRPAVAAVAVKNSLRGVRRKDWRGASVRRAPAPKQAGTT